MKFLALLLGLGIERLFTDWFDLRELRWLDSYFDRGLTFVKRFSGPVAALVAVLVVALPVLPVAAIAIRFNDVLWGLPYLAFAVAVLLVSLGPRDLRAEVEDFVDAKKRNDTERADTVAKELLETDPPHDVQHRVLAIEEAIFVQSNNRTFGVILWFMLLGPAGGWLFRVTDLFRRRAFHEAYRLGQTDAPSLRTVQRIHGLMAWLPSRLTALTLALAGSFEPAMSDWREYYREYTEHFFEVNDEVVARTGRGAMGLSTDADGDGVITEIEGAQGAMKLVARTLIVWIVAIAMFTAAGAAI